MKTLALMLVSGSTYAFIANAFSNVVNGYSPNGDTLFAFFIIGLVAGVFFARNLDWID